MYACLDFFHRSPGFLNSLWAPLRLERCRRYDLARRDAGTVTVNQCIRVLKDQPLGRGEPRESHGDVGKSMGNPMAPWHVGNLWRSKGESVVRWGIQNWHYFFHPHPVSIPNS